MGARAPAEQHQPSLHLLLQQPPPSHLLLTQSPFLRHLPASPNPNVSFPHLQVTHSSDFLHFFISCTAPCGSHHKSLEFSALLFFSHLYFFGWKRRAAPGCSGLSPQGISGVYFPHRNPLRAPEETPLPELTIAAGAGPLLGGSGCSWMSFPAGNTPGITLTPC